MTKNKTKLLLWSLANSLGTVLYVFIISQILLSGEKIFGKMEDLWGPFIFLLLFVFSAAIVGLLIFGKAIHLYLDNQKKEAFKLLFCTIGWLFLVVVIFLLICVL
ncbi:MAG: hypothetical protein PHW15_02070 [Patescibacteria group bacterium]|jgi:hypothetical protein|nr:hypothetical protein [Patescibacteria group bacterium]MDD5172933.1 hypothetical protein [Patescibacteria group bacterium]